MTVVQERETLTRVDDEVKAALEQAASAYEQAPGQLRQAIVAAARKGERPAAIVRAIGHVYTYDYVARIVRQDRAQNPGEYRAS